MYRRVDHPHGMLFYARTMVALLPLTPAPLGQVPGSPSKRLCLLLNKLKLVRLNRHKTLSLKVTYIEFNFDVSDCTMQVVTHRSKIKMLPYNSVQMI